MHYVGWIIFWMVVGYNIDNIIYLCSRIINQELHLIFNFKRMFIVMDEHGRLIFKRFYLIHKIWTPFVYAKEFIPYKASIIDEDEDEPNAPDQPEFDFIVKDDNI